VEPVSFLFPKPPGPEVRSDESPYWLKTIQRAGRWAADAGVPVSVETALTHSAVYACVDLIADTVSSFPAYRFRDSTELVGGEPRTRTTRAAGGTTIVEDPSEELDVVNWKRVILCSWLLRGYAAGLVTDGWNGYPKKIELVHPDRVGYHRTHPYGPVRWTLDGATIRKYPVGKLWLANGKMMNPEDPVGRSVLEYAAQEVGIGLAARKFGADFFRDNGIPAAVLMNDKKIEGFDEDGAKRVRERFMRAMRGNREPAVFTDGWKYEQIQVAPNESQFLESIGASRAMVASFFRVPPQAIGASTPGGAEITYQNAEQRGLDLLKFTINSWVVRLETVLTPLIVRPEYVRLNVDELLRADLRSRYESHDKSIRSGWKTSNEVRADEGLPPVEGGDQLLWPPYRSNLTEAENLGDPDQGDNALANDDEFEPPGAEEAPPGAEEAPPEDEPEP